MKKVLAVIVVSFMLAANCFASVITTTNLASAQAVGKNATAYTSVLGTDGVSKLAVRLISTAGSITVTQQCSLDGTTFYDPINSSKAALGAVIAAQGVTAGLYIEPTAVVAPYIRYKIVEGNSAATAVTLDVVTMQE